MKTKTATKLIILLIVLLAVLNLSVSRFYLERENTNTNTDIVKSSTSTDKVKYIPLGDINISDILIQDKEQQDVVDVNQEKFLYIAGWFGRFANNLIMLRSSLYLAKHLNRTLLIPTRTYQKVEFGDIFDFHHLGENIGVKFRFVNGLHKSLFNDYERGTDIHDFKKFIIRYKDYKKLFLILHSYTPYYQCISKEEEVSFWRNLILTLKYSKQIEQIKKTIKVKDYKYISVHLRKLEEMCPKYSTSHFLPKHKESRIRMCNVTYGLVHDIRKELGIDHNMPLYIATDGQDSDRDDTFFAHGALSLPLDSIDSKKYFIPALDFIMLWYSHTLIGNLMSSFSSSASMIRVSKRNINYEVLTWPLVPSSLTLDSFWYCNRFQFWCGKKIC